MFRHLDPHDMVDLEWARTMVAKGVRAVSILRQNLICEPEEVEGWLENTMAEFQRRDGSSQITACYLDLLKEPDRLGQEYTGGNLFAPVIGAVRTGEKAHAIFFATNETMADLMRWAFDLVRNGAEADKDRAHAIIGLLCGYSPLAIEGFLKQPSS